MRYKLSFVVVAILAALTIPATGTLGAQSTPTCAGLPATIVGTEGPDRLVGTALRDVIVGLGGDDQIFGAKGNDVICGNAGHDLIQGGDGRDTLIGGYGNDRIIGGGGGDDLRGGVGVDYISGKLGDDFIRGDAGVDRIAGNLGNDICTVEAVDSQITSCERGNSRTRSGRGDAVVTPQIPDDFAVTTHCFNATLCDDYFVARIMIDGAGAFDALGVHAFDADGEPISTFASVGDTLSGSFLFAGKPARIEVNSGGGIWFISFVHRSGVTVKPASASGSGNEVYRVSNPVESFGTVDASWNGLGNFAVIGVSADAGRDLLVNEVRFSGREPQPFATQAAAQANINVVQVLSSEGTWAVRLGD